MSPAPTEWTVYYNRASLLARSNISVPQRSLDHNASTQSRASTKSLQSGLAHPPPHLKCLLGRNPKTFKGAAIRVMRRVPHNIVVVSARSFAGLGIQAQQSPH